MEISQLSKKIPIEIIDKIFSYDGRIKYKRDTFINVIHPYDERYDLLIPIINKKIRIFYYTHTSYIGVKPSKTYNPIIHGKKFYFKIDFDNLHGRGLCYYYYWGEPHFEICYFNIRGEWQYWKNIRTIIY